MSYGAIARCQESSLMPTIVAHDMQWVEGAFTRK